MNPHALTALEFDKLLLILSSYAISEPAKENLIHLKPDTNPGGILQSLEEISEMRDLRQSDDPFPLSNLPDIRNLISKIKIDGAVLNPGELLQFRKILFESYQILRYFEKRSKRYPRLSHLAIKITNLKDITNSIDSAIDETGGVKDTASPRLKSLRREIILQVQQTNEKLQSLLKQLHRITQDDVITFRDSRMVIPIKFEHKNQVKGFIHDQSASGATVFIEPVEVFEMNNRIRELQTAERNEVERILTEITHRLQKDLQPIEINYIQLIFFDEIIAKSKLGEILDSHSPRVAVDRRYSLVNAQHPLLRIKSKTDNSVHGPASLLRVRGEVVPLSVEFHQDLNTIIITGPNAGGKTVALKSVGLCALMFQAGLQVPCEDHSEFTIFKNIFVDIGDEQSIENDLSTFSSRISRLKEIEEKADENSLVLLDEVGTGTDPKEGAAIAIALLERLNERKVYTLATTHYGALKSFAYNTPGMINASMEFDTKYFTPTYRLKLGLPGNSYAFDIAQRLGLSLPLLQRARQELSEGENRLEKLLTDLEQRLKDTETLSQELNLKQSEINGLLKLHRERNQQWKQYEKIERQQLKSQIHKMISDFNFKFEKLVKEIRESNATKEKIQEAKKFISESLKTESTAITEPEEKKEDSVPATTGDGELTYGDIVGMTEHDLTGEVIELEDHQGNIVIGVGNVRLKVSRKEVHKISNAKKGDAKVNIYYTPTTNVKNEIDLRGLNSEEAMEQVDKYLDDAFLAGWKEVTLIHGKGDGTLRKVLNRYLQSHPRVAAKRLGGWQEGDLGVTIVELK